jgi:RNA polymerase sigma-70 factor (sigma-E family)
MSADSLSAPPLSRYDALALLHQRHYSELVRLAFALTGDWNLAEELVQEAFVRAWRSWTNLRREQSAPAYLRTTVVNLARTSLRRRLKEARELQEAGAVRDAEQAEFAGPGARVDVPRALASLPQRKRECVVLRYYLDLSEAQTAHALGISIGTVKSQTARALQQLRPLLVPDEATASRPGRGRSGSRD